MSKLQTLMSSIEIGDTHADRLEKALIHLQHLFPFTPDTWQNLQDEELGYLELLTGRYAKLQDLIGSKIFPLILAMLQEETEGLSFLDILNKLEKLTIVPTAQWWISMRELRNHITHEYPDNPKLMASNLNKAVESSKTLLRFWHNLKLKINNILAKN
jgi:hypothetical protein